MNSYDARREKFKPGHIKILLIAESQPPDASIDSSRQFYRSEYTKSNDRLFINTIRALYPETINVNQKEIADNKEAWLHRFQADGYYMIEALEMSLAHEVTKEERQTLIRQHLPALLSRVKKLASKDTKIVLIKSNVFTVAAEPLRAAGLTVLNTELVDYPGRFNQKAYRSKLAQLVGYEATQ